MHKYIKTNITLTLFLSLIGLNLCLPAYGADKDCSSFSNTLTANLEQIATRRAKERLLFNPETKEFKTFTTSWSYEIYKSMLASLRFFGIGKTTQDRFSLIDPLSDLTTQVEEKLICQINKDTTRTLDLVRDSYRSLSTLRSLYVFYQKPEPWYKTSQNIEFLAAFADLLTRWEKIVRKAENIAGDKAIHYMPWSLASKGENDIEAKLNYYELKPEIANAQLTKNNIRNISIVKALEIHPIDEYAQTFESNVFDPQKKLAVLLVHGTRNLSGITVNKDNPEFYDNNNFEFRRLRFALQKIANYRGQVIEAYSIEWTGDNTDIARMIAGEDAAKFVHLYFPAKYYHVGALAHSHGGNKVFQLAKALRHYRPLEFAILIATPIRSDFAGGATNIENLFIISSEASDWVQTIGAINTSNIERIWISMTMWPLQATISLWNKTSEPKQTGEKISIPVNHLLREDINQIACLGKAVCKSSTLPHRLHNINLFVEGRPLDGAKQSHSDVRAQMIGMLPKVIDQILTRYQRDRSFVVDIPMAQEHVTSIHDLEAEEPRMIIDMSKPQQKISEQEEQWDALARRSFKKRYKRDFANP